MPRSGHRRNESERAMNDLLDLRIGRLCITLFAGKPFVRIGWNRIPNLFSSFGPFFIWWRGRKASWERRP
jgi:hypothetical protein